MRLSRTARGLLWALAWMAGLWLGGAIVYAAAYVVAGPRIAAAVLGLTWIGWTIYCARRAFRHREQPAPTMPDD